MQIAIKSDDADVLTSIDQFGLTLSTQLRDVISERQVIEREWQRAHELYHSKFTPKEAELFKDEPQRAKTKVGYTRSKTDAWVAQMVDRVTPNNDSNWEIKPTPVAKSVNQAIGAAQMPEDEAQAACDAMARLIDDQLVEAEYISKIRKMLRHCGKYGTGILKGPIVKPMTKKGWQKDESGWTVVMTTELIPTVEVVHPFDFFPDMTAETLGQCVGIYQRSYMIKAELKELLHDESYIQENITRVLGIEPIETKLSDSLLRETMREAEGKTGAVADKRYEIWEYHGPIPVDALIENGTGEEEDYQDDEVEGVAVFCGNYLLKMALCLQETEEKPYSVFTLDPDDHSIFGHGMPMRLEFLSEALDGAFRAMMDNARDTAGDQIVVDKSQIEPADDSWKITPNKIWYKSKSAIQVDHAFRTYSFNNHQGAYANIINMAMQFMDDNSGVPKITEGVQGTATQTYHGMAMLFNAATSVRREEVRRFDDNVITPLIQRYYDYNMSYADDDTVKGDMQIAAKGTAQYDKEVRSQSIAASMQYLDPEQISLAHKPYDVIKEYYEAIGSPVEQILRDREEFDADLEQIKQNQANQPQDPAILKAQMDMQLAQGKMQHEMQMAQFKAQVELQSEQVKGQIKLQELALRQQESVSKERLAIMKLAQDEKLSTEKMMVELRKLEQQSTVDMHKFNTEVKLKNMPALNDDGNFGLD